MATRKEHKIKNALTDTSSRGIYYNPSLYMAYQGLPNTLSKMANILMALLCDRVRYKSGKVRPGHDHISTVIPLTIDDILMNARSIAYADGKRIENDRKNYRKYLSELHKNNVFYVWQCGKFYIFIMEREVRSWLFYNKEGCVTPKTIIKIISRSRGMINVMVGFHKDDHTNFQISDIESSFGFFMNGMINKMNPLIASEDLPIWDKNKHIYEYLEDLDNKLENLETFDGLTESPDYIERLPLYVKQNLVKANGGEPMNSDLEKELAPVGKDANLSKAPRKPRKKKAKETDKKSEPTKPKKERFDKSIDPFHDGPSFTKYYKAYLHQLCGNSKIRFDDIQADNRAAVEVLDLLREHGLQTKDFINEWMKYFYHNNLKGEKIQKPENTSLSAFRYTFERYKESHYIPQ